MAMLAILVLPLSILGFTAIAVVYPPGGCVDGQSRAARLLRDPLCLTLATGNNGSAFAGLSGNTPFYNLTIGLAMLIGRFLIIVPMMAIAGSLAARRSCRRRRAPSRPRAAVRRPAGRRDPDRGRPDLLPGTGARADRRALRDDGRQAVLLELIRSDLHGNLTCPQADAGVGACSIRRSSCPRSGLAFVKLDPRTLVHNPVMFVGRDGQRC